MESNIKVVEKVGKNSGKNVVVMAGVHGNEVCGAKAFDELIPKIDVVKGKVTFIVANLKAVRQNKRCVEYNLNRCFLDEQPAEMVDTLEGRTAREIMSFLREADALLDVHSSKSSDSLKYLICEDDCLGLVSCLSPEKVVLGINDAHPGSTNGYVCRKGNPGICIECGLNETGDSVETAKEAILTFLVETGNVEGVNDKKFDKKLFRTVYIYKSKNGPFKIERDFRDFEKVTKRTLIGFDGDEEVYVEKGDVIMFIDDPKEVGEECFLVVREERLLKDDGLNKLEAKDGEDE